MRENKDRWMAVYRTRLERIYKNQPDKLNKIDEWMHTYGAVQGEDTMHAFYKKVCTKNKLKPGPKYEGQQHEGVIPEDEQEKLISPSPSPTQITPQPQKSTIGLTKSMSPPKPNTNNFQFTFNPKEYDKKKEDKKEDKPLFIVPITDKSKKK
eukprot:114900_1